MPSQLEGTSLNSAERNLTSRLRSEGNEKADEWATPTSHNAAAWSGSDTQTGTRADACPQDRSLTASANSRKQGGRMPRRGPRRSSSGASRASTSSGRPQVLGASTRSRPAIFKNCQQWKSQQKTL